MAKTAKTGRGLIAGHLQHIARACIYSLAGIKTAFHDEKAFQQIAICALCGIPAACVLADSWQDAVLLILPLALAIIVELLNTAVENVVDLASPQWHALAKKAKDTASAAQFCAQLLAAGIWATYFLCKL